MGNLCVRIMITKHIPDMDIFLDMSLGALRLSLFQSGNPEAPPVSCPSPSPPA